MLNFAVLSQAIVSGLIYGSVYALVAVGFNLIFGVLKVVNFAHGELVMLGMYGTYWAYTLLGIDPYLSILFMAPLFFIIGALIQKYLIVWIMDAPEDMQMLMTFGLMVLLSNLALLFFTADLRAISVPYLDGIVFAGPVSFRISMILAVVASLFILTLIYVIIRSTDLGKAIRATPDERDGAILVGININRIHWVTFGISSALAGAAGSIVLPFLPTSPDRGIEFVITAFIVTVLGGMGSFVGSLVGGFTIGVIRSVGQIFMSALLSNALCLAIIFLVLVLKPSGLFGKEIK